MRPRALTPLVGAVALTLAGLTPATAHAARPVLDGTEHTPAAIAPADAPVSLAASLADARVRDAVDSAAEPGQSDPVEDPYYPEYSQPEVDALHYWLDLHWDGNALSSFSTVDLRAAQDTDALHLTLGSSLRISNAWLDGRPIQVSQSGTQATFQTGHLTKGTVGRLQLTYAGTPQCVRGPSTRSDLACIGWNKSGNRVWTLQQPYGAFTWFPANETPSDKALYDVRITTTNGTVGVFNGVPMTPWDSTNGSTAVRNYHLDSATTTYLTTIAIGDYRSDSVQLPDGKQWTVWYTPAEAGSVPSAKSEATRAYSFLTQRAGAFPFSSIGNVMIPANGAMETQTMITMGSREMNPVLMHELSHQWFGDAVTPTTWKDMWLNEGWAMYMQGLYQGTPMSTFQQMCRSSVPTSGEAGSPSPSHFAENNVYYCPGPILDQIRRDLGDTRFFQIAAAWPAEHAGQSVDRAEFERWLQAKTGRDYRSLISQWLDRV